MEKAQNSSFRQYGRLLARYLRPQGKQVTLLVFLIIGSISLQLINPQLVRRFLDAAETGRNLNELVRTAVLFISIAIVAQVIKLAGAYVSENVAWTATNDLRADLALHCLRLDMSFHKKHKPGELIERVDGDVNQLANFFSQLIIQLGSNFLLVIGVLILLWLVNVWVGATVTAVAVVGLILLNYFNKHTVPRWQALRQVESDLFGYLEEWLNGAEEIQTNGAAPFILRRLYQIMRRRWRAMQRAMRMNMFIMALPIVVPTLAYIIAYIWGSQLFRSSALTIGSVYLIFYYIDVLKEPLWVIQRQVQDLQKASASLNRIMALFAEQPTIEDGTDAFLPDGALSVQFDGVSFHYDDDETDVLADVRFALEPGRILGLLGRTGSGKTTITRLLFRFYDPTVGAIRLGNSN
ncbi:MAG: ABC transporter ATP-binding protein, partial [Chloroflexi bacterium]|nr:ABC transporter ATP-binding protein [Chloroflexota bacterium]